MEIFEHFRVEECISYFCIIGFIIIIRCNFNTFIMYVLLYKLYFVNYIIY